MSKLHRSVVERTDTQLSSHYANMPVHYENIKMIFLWIKKIKYFLIFAQNIDCGYTLEPPQRGGSNEYPQSMF